jgi:hypothetical protein
VFAEEPEVEGDSSSPDGLGVGSAGSERSVDVGTIVGSAEGGDVGVIVGSTVGDGEVGENVGGIVTRPVGESVVVDNGGFVGPALYASQRSEVRVL